MNLLMLITVKQLLDQNDLLRPSKAGDIIEGKIIAREKGEVFLDLGKAGTGIIYGREFIAARGILKELKIGDSVMAKIVDLKNDQGYVELSIAQAGRELTWEELKRKKEKGEIIKIKVLGANKGGLLSEVSGVQGFLPVSQLNQQNYPKVEGGEGSKILKELQKFIGQELEVQIFDLDPRAEKLIFSEKSKEANKIREQLKNYKVGDTVEGEITGIVEFGAFVRFPASAEVLSGKGENLEGLIHISELDWKIIEDPSEIVKVGEKIKAQIINIANDKVFLSLKSLKQDPWKDIEKQYKKNDVLEGKVTKFNPFGAFVQITPEIQGLCHISEFGTQKQMEERLKIGEMYKFQILEIRASEHKMSLKLIE